MPWTGSEGLGAAAPGSTAPGSPCLPVSPRMGELDDLGLWLGHCLPGARA